MVPDRPPVSSTTSATGTSHPPTGQAPLAALHGNRLTTASGTCTCSTSPNPTSTGTIPRSSPSSTRRCGSGPTAGWTGSGWTSPTCSRRISANRCPARRSLTPPTRPWAMVAWRTATRCTTSTVTGGRSSTSTTRPGWPWPRRGCRPIAVRPTQLVRNWGRPSTSTCSRPRSGPRSCGASLTTTSPWRPGPDRRRRGCSPITTSCATPLATDCLRNCGTVGSTCWATGTPLPAMPISACDAPWLRPCSFSPCPAQPICTRGRNSGCPRWSTSPTSTVRIRRSSAHLVWTRGGTAAGCRCRGRRTVHRWGSGRVSHTSRSPPGSATLP